MKTFTIPSSIIRADGLKGNITQDNGGGWYTARWEDGTTEKFHVSDLSRYWFIAGRILGNKVPPEQLEQEIEQAKEEIRECYRQQDLLSSPDSAEYQAIREKKEALREKYDLLRKQLYRLNNQMYEGWMANRLAIQKSHTEMRHFDEEP